MDGTVDGATADAENMKVVLCTVAKETDDERGMGGFEGPEAPLRAGPFFEPGFDGLKNLGGTIYEGLCGGHCIFIFRHCGFPFFIRCGLVGIFRGWGLLCF
jgi:hypothetical protein